MTAMFYATAKGTPQSYPDAAKWWTKAAEAGHVLSAQSLSMVYRGGSGVKSNPELSAQWGKYYTEHSPTF
jgi:TPR repeat protein